MSLPNPLPDNPTRWDGWKGYNSDNLYDRLCLDFDANPTAEQIEQNCRQLLVWWQKKLPLKNQPSNPLAQLLRGGLEEAPAYLADARTKLLDPEVRAWHDSELRVRIVEQAVGEFKKILPFAVVNDQLTVDSEERLYEAGSKLGLMRDEMKEVLDAEVERLSVTRVASAPVAGGSPASAAGMEAREPFEEFRRMLRLSKLCLDGDEMTDDQRDALCNMGESLGLSGGQAEDLIDEYLEAASTMVAPPQPERKPVLPSVRPSPKATAPPIPTKGAPAAVVPSREAVAQKVVNTSPVARIKEREQFPNFRSSAGLEMLLVPSGIFFMGSDARDAAPHEQPAIQTTLSCFHMSRHPVTNAQYELFDPAHRNKRAPWATENHPVVYVSSRDASDFCQWLSLKEGRRYRLPSEAEWEYAARGSDARTFPWGHRLDAGDYANFADRSSVFAWRDEGIDDGHAETAPVGSYPRGASPFLIEDLAGNVFEWCGDFFEFYRGKARVNPRGPATGTKRIYRGGSWKSRISSLRASARAFNSPEYIANDVGFRIVCECE